MADYRIITDSCSDLTVELIRKLDITVAPLNMLFQGNVRVDSVAEDIKEVYEALRQGEAASTSALNPDQWASYMEPVLAAGEDVLVLAFSSGLSTTYQSAVIAAICQKSIRTGRSGWWIPFVLLWVRDFWFTMPAKSGMREWIWILWLSGCRITV